MCGGQQSWHSYRSAHHLRYVCRESPGRTRMRRRVDTRVQIHLPVAQGAGVPCRAHQKAQLLAPQVTGLKDPDWLIATANEPYFRHQLRLLCQLWRQQALAATAAQWCRRPIQRARQMRQPALSQLQSLANLNRRTGLVHRIKMNAGYAAIAQLVT